MRKPSPRSVLKTQPPEIQERLAEYLASHTLAEGVAYCRDELKLRTNDTSLSDWLGWYKLNDRLAKYSEEAEEFKAALLQTSVDPDLVPKLGEALFLSRAAQEGDVKTFTRVASVLQRSAELKAQQDAHKDKIAIAERQTALRGESLKLMRQKLDNAERRIAALEAIKEQNKQAAQKAKDVLSAGALTDAQRDELLSTMDEMILGKKRKAPKAA